MSLRVTQSLVLVWAGIMTPQQLADKRPYVIVGAFVIEIRY
jgi:sec-independent protein translocase protein TatC